MKADIHGYARKLESLKERLKSADFDPQTRKLEEDETPAGIFGGFGPINIAATLLYACCIIFARSDRNGQ